MRHGVGQWLAILGTGLLPGKLIQQLYGQTQRLLGQQSLAGMLWAPGGGGGGGAEAKPEGGEGRRVCGRSVGVGWGGSEA